MRACLLVVMVWAPCAAAENSWLTKANAAYDELKYADAAKALEQAAKVADNDRAAVLRILELTAIVQATLKNPARAEEAFRQLFALNPDFKLDRELAPRVMTPYYQARSWVAEHGALAVTALPPRVEGGVISRIGVKLSDPVKLARGVLFHLRQPGGDWAVQSADVAADRCSVATSAADLEWWAEVVGDRGARLHIVGFADTPFVERASAPSAATPAPESALALEPVVAARPAASPRSGLRLPAYVLAGAGVVSTGVAVALGLRAQAARAELAQATFDTDGRVLTPTQARAVQLEGQLKSSAVAADVLWSVAGVLIATGLALWLVSLWG